MLKKVGEDKKFVPLYADKIKEDARVPEETKETKEVKVEEKQEEVKKTNAS